MRLQQGIKLIFTRAMTTLRTSLMKIISIYSKSRTLKFKADFFKQAPKLHFVKNLRVAILFKRVIQVCILCKFFWKTRMFPVFCVSSLYYMQCHLYRIHNICIYDCLYNHLGASLISSSLHKSYLWARKNVIWKYASKKFWV